MKKMLSFVIAVCAVFLLAGYLAAEQDVESADTDVIAISPDKVSENVEEEVPVDKTNDKEEFEIYKGSTRITSNVIGDIGMDKEKLPPFETETIKASKFKADARIVESSDRINNKMMLSSGDLVRINIGANKNIKEGSFFSIYKTGQSISKRGKLYESEESIDKEEKMAKKEVLVVTKVADAKVIEVKSNYSIIRILRCLEPVIVGDYAKLNRD